MATGATYTYTQVDESDHTLTLKAWNDGQYCGEQAYSINYNTPNTVPEIALNIRQSLQNPLPGVIKWFSGQTVALPINPVNTSTLDYWITATDVDGDPLIVQLDIGNNGSVEITKDLSVDPSPIIDGSYSTPGDRIVAFIADDGNGGTDTVVVTNSIFD